MQVRYCATLGLMVAGILGCSDNNVGVSQEELHSIETDHVCAHGHVPMCHHSHDGGAHTICVPPWRVFWHLDHGDSLGRCGQECPPPVECGDGTVLVDGECVPTTPPVACGPGTVEQNGLCVPTSTLVCGPGTIEQNGQCVPDNLFACGPGTVAQNGQCVVENPLTCGAGTVAQNGQCVVENPLTCGPGTVAQAGQCVVENPLTCGTGTVAAGGVCSPDYTFLCGAGTAPQNGQCVVSNPITCGTNTVLQDGQCTPNLSQICATGTTAQNGECVVSNPIVCGPGTVLQNGQCVPTSQLTCGTGTVAVNGQCVPDLTTLCGAGTVAQNGVCVAAGSGTCDVDHVSVTTCVCASGDDDNDGVCNDSDQCPGFDDHIDTNGDGIPDGCDTQIDAFEPNDVNPYPQQYFPFQVFPILSGPTDVDKFSFTADAGHMIVIQVCAFLSDTDIEPPLTELRLGDQVLFSNANNTTSGCPSAILVPVATRATYVVSFQQRPQWNIARLLYSLVMQIT